MSILDLFRKRSESDKHLAFALKETLGFAPGSLALYKLALRHKSVAKEIKDGFKNSNERLEFLGDAVLDAAVAHYLFAKYPYKDEGFLTKLRAKIVSRTHLNALAGKLGIDQLVESSLEVDTMSTSIAGDALEALIGAVYLDRGYAKSVDFVHHRLIRDYVNLDELQSNVTDYKSRLIEWTQKHKKDIVFDTVEEGESGNDKVYVSTVLIAGEKYGHGRGLSKKKAEQKAAEEAWGKLPHDDKS